MFNCSTSIKNDKYACNNHMDFIFIYARHTKRNKKEGENVTKIYNWDHKKYIQHFLAKSIEHFRRRDMCREETG